MRNVNAAEARDDFADTVNRVAYGKERIVISRRGKELAAVIPIEDLHLLERLIAEAEDRLDIEAARRALKKSEREGTTSLDVLKRDLGL